MSRRAIFATTLTTCAFASLLLLGGCEKTAADDLAAAKSSIAAKDARTAMLHLKNVIKKEPNLAEARFLLGQQLLAAGDARGALIELKRAEEFKFPREQVAAPLAESMLQLGQSPQLIMKFDKQTYQDPAVATRVNTALAFAQMTLGNLPEADRIIQLAVSAAPKEIPPRLVKARIALARGDAAAAVEQAESMLAQAPKNDVVWAFKGEALERNAAGVDKALEAYAKALEFNPQQVQALSSTLGLQLLRNELVKAGATLETLRKVAPKAYLTLYYDARFQHLSGNYAAARTLFQSVLGIAPDNAVALLASGVNELRMNSNIQAEALLSRAISRDSTNAVARYYLGQTYLRLGRPDQAASTLAPLLTASAVVPEVLLLAAQAQLLKGDPRGAEALFSRAAKLHPNNPDVRVALALHSGAAQGGSETALRELQAIALSSDSTVADIQLISAHIAKSRFDAALAAIDALARKRPDDPSAPNLRGEVLVRKKDTAGARAAFEAALAKDPRYMPAVGNLADLDLSEGKTELVKKRINDLAAKEPGNANVQIALASLAAKMGASHAEIAKLITKATIADPNDSRARLLLIERLVDSGQSRAALQAAQAAVAAIPENATLLDAQGRIQLRLGESQQALATYSNLRRVAPNEPAGYLGHATVQYGLKDYEGANKTLQQLLAIHPRSLDGRRMAIGTAIKLKQMDRAKELVKELQTEFPEQSYGWALEGEVHMEQGQWAAASAAFTKGLTKLQAEPLAQRLHTAYLKDNKPADAERLVASWIKTHPKDVTFLGYLGDTAYHTNHRAEAKKRFQQVLVIEPKNPGALNNLAWLMLQDKQPEAVAIAERAVEQAPDQADVLDTLGQAYAMTQQYPKAIDALRRAIDRALNPAPLRLSLAKVYILAGDSKGAVSELDRLRLLGKDFPQHVEVRELIASLRK